MPDLPSLRSIAIKLCRPCPLKLKMLELAWLEHMHSPSSRSACRAASPSSPKRHLVISTTTVQRYPAVGASRISTSVKLPAINLARLFSFLGNSIHMRYFLYFGFSSASCSFNRHGTASDTSVVGGEAFIIHVEPNRVARVNQVATRGCPFRFKE